jgi:hypothetical protein
MSARRSQPEEPIMQSFSRLTATTVLALAAVAFAGGALAQEPTTGTRIRQQPQTLQTIVVPGATTQGRADALDAEEAARPARAELPTVDAAAWLPAEDARTLD